MYLYIHKEKTRLPSKHIPAHIDYDHTWFSLNAQNLIIKGNRPDKDGYAFDGCSPKFQLFGHTIGTPDGPLLPNGLPITYYAALAHDVLYQHAGLHPLTRYQCDAIFYQYLRVTGWPWGGLYFIGVRWFGGWWWYRDRNNNSDTHTRGASRVTYR